MTTAAVTDRKAEYLAASPPPGPPPHADMVWIPGGAFLMGSEDFYPEERPVHQVSVDGFWMDRFEVTVADFRRFVQATGYVTVAERPLRRASTIPGVDPTLLVPGSLVFRKATGPVRLDDYRNWWGWVPGASWTRPEGPGSHLQGRARHPITQVTVEDAEAFAAWAGKTLPTEAEWEFASRGGLEGATFTWGNEFAPKNRMMANTWQGEFPWQNLRTDGFEGTSPVGTFPPNGYGLFDMAGNVWEWTSDFYTTRSPRRGRRSSVLRAAQPTRGIAGAELRRRTAGPDDPAASHQGRLASVRTELLLALPAGRAPAADDRVVHLAHRVPLHRPGRCRLTARLTGKVFIPCGAGGSAPAGA